MDDIDKIHELLKTHGAILERTKKHKVWRFPDGRIWVVSGSPSCIRAHRNNYHSLCGFLGVKEVRRKNPYRKEKIGVGRTPDFKPAEVIVHDFRDTLAAIKKYFRPDVCAGTMWLERVPRSPWAIILRRIFG